MQCIDCNEELCVRLMWQGVYVCQRNHLLCHMCVQKNGNRCEICGDTNLVQLTCNCIEQNSNSNLSLEAKKNKVKEIEAQIHAISNVTDDILQLVMSDQSNIFANKAFIELNQCLNLLTNLCGMHEATIDLNSVESTQNVFTQISLELSTKDQILQTETESYCQTTEQNTQTNIDMETSNGQNTQTQIDIWSVPKNDNDKAHTSDSHKFKNYVQNTQTQTDIWSVPKNDNYEAHTSDSYKFKNYGQNIQTQVDIWSVPTNVENQIFNTSDSAKLKNYGENTHICLVPNNSIDNDALDYVKLENQTQTDNWSVQNNVSENKTITVDDSVESQDPIDINLTHTDIWSVPNNHIDYTIMTVDKVSKPQTVDVMKPKSFDHRMHALYNAYRECPFDLVQPNHYSLDLPSKGRNMHIPTAPLEEIVSDELSENWKWKNVKLAQRNRHSNKLQNNQETSELVNEPENMEWKYCENSREESIYTSEHVLMSQQLATSDEYTTENSVKDKKSLQKKMKRQTSILKLNRTKFRTLKKSSLWDWSIFHIPKVWRVLNNPKRKINCPLHTTVQTCRCDLKAYGHSPMIQPVVNVPMNRNYRLNTPNIYKYEQLTMLHAPINCPDALCHRKFLIPDCCYHYISQHSKLPVHHLYPAERIDFELHPCPAQDNCNRSKLLLLVKDKIQGVGHNQYNDCLPLILMTARLQLSALARIQSNDLMKLNKRNEDYLLVWICGLSAFEFKTSYTLTTWRYKQNIPLCHISHSSTIVNIRNKQTPLKIYESGRALLLSPNELYILTGAHSDLLQCQIVVN